MRFIDVQNFAAVKDNHELQQGAEKPEVGIADDGQMKRPVGPNDLDLLEQVAKNVEAEFSGRIGGGNARDREAGRETYECAAGKNKARQHLASVESLRKQRPDHRAGNNRDERRQFKNPVAPGQQFVRKHFGKQTVFCGTEKGRLRARQKNHGECHARAAVGKRVEREKHRENFEDLRGHGYGSFAEAVRQIAARHGKQQEGHGEQVSDVKNQQVFLRIGGIGSEDKKNDEKLQAVVVERALKLRGDQAPKAEPPLSARLFSQRNSVVGHAGAPTHSSGGYSNRTILAAILARAWATARACAESETFDGPGLARRRIVRVWPR